MKTKLLKNAISIICISYVISCFAKTTEGNDLALIGFYSTPDKIIKILDKNDPGFKEHFLLGVAFKKKGKMKSAIYHFANSCFKYESNIKLKLYPHPVYKFVDGFNFKSNYYNDAVYEIASLFYEYREFKYVVKFVDLISDEEKALYRDAVILKSKALKELNEYNESITILKKLLSDYEDINSISSIQIRIAAVYEALNYYNKAFKEYLKILQIDRKSWQADIACNRIMRLIPNCNYMASNKEILLLAGALYHNSKYDESIKLLKSVLKIKTEPAINNEAIKYLIKSLLRRKKIQNAENFISTFKNNKDIYIRLLKIMADELWAMRSRAKSVKIYKRLLKIEKEPELNKSLKRIALYMQRKKINGYKNFLKRFIKSYPNDKTSEYFSWLLTKNKIKEKKYKEALKYLEESKSRFSNGVYSARNRFWLYKLY